MKANVAVQGEPPDWAGIVLDLPSVAISSHLLATINPGACNGVGDPISVDI